MLKKKLVGEKTSQEKEAKDMLVEKLGKKEQTLKGAAEERLSESGQEYNNEELQFLVIQTL